MGGKNSVFRKPLGKGSGSINKAGRNLVGKGAWDAGAKGAEYMANPLKLTGELIGGKQKATKGTSRYYITGVFRRGKDSGSHVSI